MLIQSVLHDIMYIHINWNLSRDIQAFLQVVVAYLSVLPSGLL